MPKIILMWHPELDDSVKPVSERAFENVHSAKGWLRWEDPEPANAELEISEDEDDLSEYET